MTDLKKILVVADKGMRRTAAIERGLLLARKMKAQLHLCMFTYDPLIEETADLVSPGVMRLARAQLIGQCRTWLAAQAGSWVDHGLSVECDVVWSPIPEDAILDKILEVGPDLVIKDVQQEPLRQRLFHSPLDLRILRLSPVPVMMVRSANKYLPRRIAAAVDIVAASQDIHPLNQTVVDEALKLGGYCGAEVHVVHVQEPFMPLSPESVLLYDAFAKVQVAERETYLQYCRQRSIPDECRHLLSGEPTSELVRFAQRMNIDVLVLGSAYRSTLNRFFLGSTSEGVLNEANCDVLLVKPTDFHEQLTKHMNLNDLHQRQLAVGA